MHHVALRPDDQRVSQFGKLKLPSLRAKGYVATMTKNSAMMTELTVDA